MGRGLLPCFPALDLGGNDPFSVLLLNHAWGEGYVRFAPLLCGESGPGGLFSWLVSYGAAAYSPAAAQASAARRRHPQFRRGPSLPRRLAGPASFNAGPVFPFWPLPKPFRAAAFLRLALFDGASPASASLALSRKGELLCRAPAAAAVIVWASSADVSSVPECLEPGLGLMLCQEKRIPVASGPRNEPCGKNLGFLQPWKGLSGAGVPDSCQFQAPRVVCRYRNPRFLPKRRSWGRRHAGVSDSCQNCTRFQQPARE